MRPVIQATVPVFVERQQQQEISLSEEVGGDLMPGGQMQKVGADVDTAGHPLS